MGLLYVNESGAVIGVEANKCTVQYKDGMKKMIPIESLEGITIMGRSQMTTQCAEECMVRESLWHIFLRVGVILEDLCQQDILMWKDREDRVKCMTLNFPYNCLRTLLMQK